MHEALAAKKNELEEMSFSTVEEAISLSDNAPINVMYCDVKTFTIRYVNKKSMDTLHQIAKLLPIPPAKVLGAQIDIFHKDPSYQRKFLGNEKNLPHKSIIQLGPEKLELNVFPIFNTQGKYSGAMISWDIVTQRLITETNLARMQSVMENAPINIMSSDNDLKIVYMNRRSKETLATLQKYLPVSVDKVVGASIDIFHKDVNHQRRILSNDKNLPHKAVIRLGDQSLSLLVSAVYDENRKYMGPMVTWEVVTDREHLMKTLEETSSQLAAAADELSATARELSKNSEATTQQSISASSNTEEVSKGVQTVATNTEEMVASIKEISRSSSEAANISKETMKRAQDTNKTITKLGASSQEVGNVIKVISSIAQQTNLLALNATIEAARAGDAGKGFAVVANEVKELAKQTADATEDITNKIGAIQGDTGHAVSAIGEIANVIEKLNGISVSIAASIEEQTATTNEVARVVKESNKGVDGIAEVIKNVSAAAKQSSAGAAQTLEAARSLAQLADKLRNLVKNMKNNN